MSFISVTSFSIFFIFMSALALLSKEDLSTTEPSALLLGQARALDIATLPRSTTKACPLDAAMWLSCRATLAECALKQGRIENAFRHCDLGAIEAVRVKATVFARRFEAMRCAAAARHGDDSVVSAVQALLAAHQKAHARDTDYVKALVFAASLRRDAVVAAVDTSDAAAQLAAAQALLAAADSVLRKNAADLGWIGVDDKALTFGDSLGTIPIDDRDIAPPTPLANLYLAPVRWLAQLGLAIVENLLDLAKAADIKAVSDHHLRVLVGFGAADNDVVTGDDVRAAALRKAEEALATTRHVVSTPPALRAALLLAVGGCRRCQRDFKRRRRQESKQQLDKKRQIDDDDETATAQVAAALEAALEVSFRAGGHDYVVMRDAALELVRLYGLQSLRGSEARHLVFATHYLQLAAKLMAKRDHLLQNLSSVAEKSPVITQTRDDAPFFSKTDLHEMGLFQDDTIDTATALRCLLALRGEAQSSLLEAPSRDLGARVHQVLYARIDPYRLDCCVSADDLRLADNATVPEAIVCAQWLPADNIIQTSDDNEDDNEGGFNPRVEAYVLLGAIPANERFKESPHLLRVNASKVSELVAMRRRASSLKYALQRELSQRKNNDDTGSPDLAKRFEQFLCDLHLFLNPSSPNADVAKSQLLDSTGMPMGLLCDIETLTILDNFLDHDRGAFAPHKRLCFFFRDLWAIDPPSLSTTISSS